VSFHDSSKAISIVTTILFPSVQYQPEWASINWNAVARYSSVCAAASRFSGISRTIQRPSCVRIIYAFGWSPQRSLRSLVSTSQKTKHKSPSADECHIGGRHLRPHYSVAANTAAYSSSPGTNYNVRDFKSFSREK
jgi:hypothetical protein